jgi:acetyl-CoA C-acetyltransferase
MGAWARPLKSSYQGEIDAMAAPEVTETPAGAATIETYTVIHAREGMRMGIVIGRDEAGRRFVANTPKGDIDIMAFPEEVAVKVPHSSGVSVRNLQSKAP